MRFKPLDGESLPSPSFEDEYKTGEKIGIITLGESAFFFKKGLAVLFIPYEKIERVFRRVYLVKTRKDSRMEVENICICAGGKECAEVQLPGKDSAISIMEKLKKKAPNASFGKEDK